NGVNIANGATGNGSTYAGVTTATLTISGTVVADAAAAASGFDCVVSGTCSPSATSTRVALTVNTATAITAQPTAQTVCAGTTASFSVTATGAALTYQWRKNGVNISDGATGNGSAYSGTSTATLQISSVATADAAAAASGFDCVVSGTCNPSATSTRVALTVNTLPAISTQPSNQTVCAGATATFSVTATGTALTYQWQLSSDGGTTFNNVSGAT